MSANEQAVMAEFANSLWNNFIRQKVEEMLTQNVSFYLATVTANNGNNSLTVQAPLDNARTVSCTSQLSNVSAGTNVAVLQLGNSNAAVNHLAFLNLNGNNLITNPLPVSLGGTNATTASSALANLGGVPYIGRITDLNNVTDVSISYFPSSASNKPTTAGGSLITTPAADPYVHQLVLPNASAGTSTAYIRQLTADGWVAWTKL